MFFNMNFNINFNMNSNLDQIINQNDNTSIDFEESFEFQNIYHFDSSDFDDFSP